MSFSDFVNEVNSVGSTPTPIRQMAGGLVLPGSIAAVVADYWVMQIEAIEIDTPKGVDNKGGSDDSI